MQYVIIIQLVGTYIQNKAETNINVKVKVLCI